MRSIEMESTRMNRWLAVIGALCLAVASLPARAQEQTAIAQHARELAIGVCGVCHGPDGNSKNPMFPRLAGQRAWYLVQQLQAFQDESRGDPYAIAYMWGMARKLHAPTIEALAQYFSRQKTGPGKRYDQARLARGREIFEHGVPSQGVPACAVCHGPHALGSNTFPRLAGQHAEYILKQLASFQSNMRNIAIMHGVAQNLPKPQMEAVADYLASLR